MIRAHSSRRYIGWCISRTSRRENIFSQKLVTILGPDLQKCATSSAVPWQKLGMSDDHRSSFSGVNEYNKNHHYGLTFLTPKSLPDFISFVFYCLLTQGNAEYLFVMQTRMFTWECRYTVNKCFPHHMTVKSHLRSRSNLWFLWMSILSLTSVQE